MTADAVAGCLWCTELNSTAVLGSRVGAYWLVLFTVRLSNVGCSIARELERVQQLHEVNLRF